jgi:serpin B
MQAQNDDLRPKSHRRAFLKGAGSLGLLLGSGRVLPFAYAAETGKPEIALTASFAALGGDLYGALTEGRSNLIFSPYSAGTAMAMTAAGARGVTEAELRKVLHLTLSREDMNRASLEVLTALKRGADGNNRKPCPADGDAETGTCRDRADTDERCREKSGTETGECGKKEQATPPQLFIANALMLSKWGPMISDDFRAALSAYQATLFADASLETVNGWVKENTGGKIDRILESFGREPSLVLLNAIYFKAAWETPFHKGATKERDFHLAGGNSVKTSAMAMTDYFRLAKRPGYRALELPYRGETLSMTVVLPDKIEDLASAGRALGRGALGSLIKSVAAQPKKRVALVLPRFKTSTDVDLAGPFQKLGVKIAFSAAADFTGMLRKDASEERFQIGQIRHRAMLEVKEEGTEAAAATAVAMVRSMAVPQREAEPIPFVVDRPFLFFVSDAATGAILFQGRISDPTQTA